LFLPLELLQVAVRLPHPLRQPPSDQAQAHKRQLLLNNRKLAIQLFLVAYTVHKVSGGGMIIITLSYLINFSKFTKFF
jgi:hypothetical protein